MPYLIHVAVSTFALVSFVTLGSLLIMADIQQNPLSKEYRAQVGWGQPYGMCMVIVVHAACGLESMPKVLRMQSMVVQGSVKCTT